MVKEDKTGIHGDAQNSADFQRTSPTNPQKRQKEERTLPALNAAATGAEQYDSVVVVKKEKKTNQRMKEIDSFSQLFKRNWFMQNSALKAGTVGELSHSEPGITRYSQTVGGGGWSPA